MERSSTAKAAGIAAAGIFTMAAGSEVARIVLNKPWPGTTPLHSHLVGTGLAVLWLAAAVITGLGRRRFALVTIFATFAFLPHFIIARAGGGSFYSIAFLIAVPALIVLSWLAFDRKLRLGRPETESEMPEPPRDPGRAVV